MNKLTALVLPALQRFKNCNPLKHNPQEHLLLWQENKVNTGIMLKVYSTAYDRTFLDFYAVGNIRPGFRKSMSFEGFTDLLKQRGVMEKDINLLTSK